MNESLLNENIFSNRIRSLLRQYAVLINLGIRRNFSSSYIWVMLLLGVIPVFIGGISCINRLLNYKSTNIKSPADVNLLFNMLFRTLDIHFISFFIASIFGFSLLRKELDGRTLHYLFLQPVSKASIIISKYISFVIFTWIWLSLTFILSYVLFQIPFGFKSIIADLFQNRKILILSQECFVMLVALAVYGSIAMVFGSIFKSGAYGIIFYLWETGVPYLPSTLKYFTISHYLQALTPEKNLVPVKFFELLGDIPSTFRCLLTLSIILIIFISITILIVRCYECKYAE